MAIAIPTAFRGAKAERSLRRLAATADGALKGVDTSDLRALYEAAGLPPTDVMTNGAAAIFHDRMEAALLWTNLRTSVSLEELQRHLVLRHLADDMPFERLITLIDTLKDATRMGTAAWLAPPFSEEARWIEALGAAKDYARAYRRPEDYVSYRNPRHETVARAIKRLRAAGFRVEVRDSRAFISDAEEEKIVTLLETGIREVGAFHFADYLFQRMRNWYDAEQNRHHAVRRVDTMGRNDGIPVTPVAYLLQLAAKSATIPSTPNSKGRERADSLIDVATAFADALDIRSGSAFESMFKTDRTILPYLREIVLFDGTYTLVQTRPRDVSRILRGVFDWLSPGYVLPHAGCTVPQLAAIADAVAEVADFKGPGILSRTAIEQRLPPGAGIDVGRALDACSHASDRVNASFKRPWDQTKATLWEKPFIKDGGDYLMMDPAWCSPAFYEVVAAELRDASVANVERKIGFAIERLVHAELRAHGVTVVSASGIAQKRPKGIV